MEAAYEPAETVAPDGVTMFGHDLDMPAVLYQCPRCRKGELRWDDRFAWRCSSTDCLHGMSLHAIFDSDTAEFEALIGKRLQLSALALSAIGAVLVYVGILRRGWTNQSAARRRLSTLKPDDRQALFSAVGGAR